MFSKKTLLVIGIIIIAAGIAAFLYFRKATAAPTMTFAMIKPDASTQHVGDIIKAIQTNGFAIVRMEQLQLTKEKAEEFYAVHKDKPFYNDLVAFMTSGPVVVMALKKDNAIQAWRDLMGATDPEKAAEGTLRKQFGTSIQKNAVHGSDAPETAKTELAFFFPDLK